MAIKMDGHTITSLQLKASDGSEVTKQLTEEGTIPTPTEALNITANGTYDVTDKASAVVNVPAPEINLQTKTATTNGDVVADAGYDGLEKVIVNVSGDVPTLITKSITANGTYPASADNADGYSSVTVNVPDPVINLQDKTITTNGTYSADAGYDGLGEVVVNVSGGGGDTPSETFTFTPDVVIGKSEGTGATGGTAQTVAYIYALLANKNYDYAVITSNSGTEYHLGLRKMALAYMQPEKVSDSQLWWKIIGGWRWNSNIGELQYTINETTTLVSSLLMSPDYVYTVKLYVV